MIENPYAPLERAIAAAVVEIRSLRDQRNALQARVDQLENRLAARVGDADWPAPPQPHGDIGADSGGASERLQQLETEREAIKTSLLRLQARLGYLGTTEPEERQNDHH